MPCTNSAELLHIFINKSQAVFPRMFEVSKMRLHWRFPVFHHACVNRRRWNF